jgi:hypothetical protein
MARRPALRVIVSYGAQGLEVRSVARIQKRVQRSQELEAPGPAAGAWMTVEDRGGRALFRHRLPIRLAEREVFDEDGRMRIVRMPDHADAIALVVPDIPDAEDLVISIIDRGPDTGAEARPAVLKVSIADLAAQASGGEAGRGRQ